MRAPGGSWWQRGGIKRFHGALPAFYSGAELMRQYYMARRN